jgi:hypothetical protein
MIVLILLTVLFVITPTLYILNSKYVQRIALFIGATQIALLAFSGKIDNQLSDFMVVGINKIVSISYNVIIQKVCLFLAGI